MIDPTDAAEPMAAAEPDPPSPSARARRPRRSPRQAVVALVAVGCVAGAAIAVTSSSGAGASGSDGPTAAAAARTLRVTASEGGSLARADTTTVVYDGTGGRVGGGPAGSDTPVQGQGASTATVAEIAPSCPPASTSTSSSSTSTSAPTTSTTACPTTTSSSTTSSTSSTTSTTAPPTTDPPREDPPQDQPDDSAPTGSVPDASRGLTPDGADGADGSTGDTATGSRSATLTELLPTGSTADRGSVLYRADAEPIVALLSAAPLFRDLTIGVPDGPDVAALEANLVALGYGSGVTQDEHFDAGTAAAVLRWETALGRSAPDGLVAVGEVVFLAAPTAVLEHQVEVGDLLEPGDPVLVLGAESRVVDTDIAATKVHDWPVGTPVELQWGDDTTSAGSVTSVSRDEVDGEIDLVVTISGDGGSDRPIGSSVKVVRTVSDESADVAVPVAAVVEGAHGPSVRLVQGGDDRLVPVKLGIVADGWVEVTTGIHAGDQVRLPR